MVVSIFKLLTQIIVFVYSYPIVMRIFHPWKRIGEIREIKTFIIMKQEANVTKKI